VARARAIVTVGERPPSTPLLRCKRKSRGCRPRRSLGAGFPSERQVRPNFRCDPINVVRCQGPNAIAAKPCGRRDQPRHRPQAPASRRRSDPASAEKTAAISYRYRLS
jgi:hypothetical protein